ncbi:MAG: hypothetical protein ACKVU2_00400 [Saprospiraceae bacterium]
MKLLSNIFKSTLTLVALTTVGLCAVFAGPDSLGAAIDSLGVVSYTDPASFVTPAATDSVEVAITILLGLFAGAIPGLKRIPQKFIRSGAAALLVAGGAATFKMGFLTQESLEYVIQQFLPNFAYAGLIYNVLKYGLPVVGKLLGKDWTFFQSIKP